MVEEEKRVAVYTRVSTEDQAKEGFSLNSQRERLASYCTARGWTIVAEYVDDGHSGRSTNRPAYQRMLEERDRWDVLLVIKMDRIHRNSKNFMEMMDHLNANGKEFISMSESLDTSTAMGRFVMDIIQRIAQLESEQIGERVYWGMEQKAREGNGSLGSQPPYGYTYVDGTLVPDEEETQTVRYIFDRFLQKVSYKRIADELTEGGAPTKRGGRWTQQTIHNIVSNPVYCGYLHWEDHVWANGHAAVLPVETFNKAQVERYRRARKKDLDNAPLRLEPLVVDATRSGSGGPAGPGVERPATGAEDDDRARHPPERDVGGDRVVRKREERHGEDEERGDGDGARAEADKEEEADERLDESGGSDPEGGRDGAEGETVVVHGPERGGG